MIIVCPHCNDYIEIISINCSIFRHGVYKNNFQQLNPHLKKEDCDNAIKQDLIYGCGKPFKIVNELVVKCDYI